MRKIVIVDDDKQFITSFKEKLIAYNIENVESYLTVDMNELLVKDIDILFLDIDIGKDNGIDVAKHLHTNKNIKNIIFVSQNEGVIHDTLKLQPLYFIRKRHIDKDLEDAMHIVKESLSNHNVSGFNHNYVDVQDILYIESHDHDICIYNNHECIRIRTTLKKLEQELKEMNFVRIHRSYIVNIKKVKRIMSTYVILENDIKLEVGRRYKINIKDYVNQNILFK